MARVDSVVLTAEELAGKIIGVCGKNSARLATILSRGSLVRGDTRYRWAPVQVSPEDIDRILDQFPDYDPELAFDGARCVRIVFRDGLGEFEITREVGSQKRVLRRKSFWEDAVAVLGRLDLHCERYSYSEEADVFVADLPHETRLRLAQLAPRLRFTTLEARLRSLGSDRVSLYTRRSGAE